MKPIFLLPLCLGISILGSTQARAQSVWNDSAGDADWFNAGNWSGGVPSSGTATQIGTMLVGDNIIGIAGTSATVASFTFNGTLNTDVSILPGGGEQLTVNGNITNSSSFQDSFVLAVNAGANGTYAGGTGGLSFNFLNVNTRAIGTTGSVAVGSGGSLVFDLNSIGNYGSIGTTAVAGATINIAGTYTGAAGNVFDLTTGDFSGATLGTLPTLNAGFTWDTTNFLSQGILQVQSVPEPSTYVLFGAGLLSLGWMKRRRNLRTLK